MDDGSVTAPYRTAELALNQAEVTRPQLFAAIQPAGAKNGW
jgi:hypothetical protein